MPGRGLHISTTNNQHSFATVPRAEIQRSVFDRSSGHKTTFNAGLLIPCFIDEVLPGDTIDMRMSAFGRLPTLIRPIMDNVFIDVFFFFVPNRLVWSNWKRQQGEQDNPGDSTNYLTPQIIANAAGGWGELSIGDYYGLPTKVNSLASNALPFRGYNLIYNEWFRDENLCTRLVTNLGDGPDSYSQYVVKRRGKRHDYFTACLPFAQKGTAVTVPLGTTANVKTQTAEHTTSGTQPNLLFRKVADNLVPGTNQAAAYGASGVFGVAAGTAATMSNATYPTNLIADLTGATAATINQLREAFQIQRLFERDARGGTRYTEIIRSHFGVISPDARLQRPEYLGGGSIRVNVSAVTSTGEGTNLAIGDLGAYGTFGNNEVRFKQSFTEHGFIHGIMCMRADLNYQQGMERMWNRRSRFDYFLPVLAHLGEQAVLNKEIYAKQDANDDLVFGYQERYAEYRYKPSIITGRLRSNATTTLDSWHLAQNFTALPVLNNTFIEENPPIDRVVAVAGGTEPHAVCDMFFQHKWARPMPVFGVPGLIDHF